MEPSNSLQIHLSRWSPALGPRANYEFFNDIDPELTLATVSNWETRHSNPRSRSPITEDKSVCTQPAGRSASCLPPL